MENKIELNTDNFIQQLDLLIPEFKEIRRNDRDDSLEHYGIFWELSSELKKLIDNNIDGKNIPLMEKYFNYVNLIVNTKDDYVYQVMRDTIIESLALSGKKYYEAAKKYMSDYGFGIVESCRKNPPLGVKSPKYE